MENINLIIKATPSSINLENGHVFHESLLMVIIRRIQEQLSAKQRIGKNSLYPLAELNHCVFNPTNRFVIDKIEVTEKKNIFANEIYH